MSEFAINSMDNSLSVQPRAQLQKQRLAGPTGTSISSDLFDKNTDHIIRGKKTPGGHNTPGWFISRPIHVWGKIDEELGGKAPEFVFSRPGVWTGKLIQKAKPLAPIGEVVEVGLGRIPGFIMGFNGLVIGNALQLAGAGIRTGVDALLGIKTVPGKTAGAVGKGAKAIVNGTVSVVSAPFKAIF